MSDNIIQLNRQRGVQYDPHECFWCGERDGVILMGEVRPKRQYPMEPCGKCQQKMDAGITIIEASSVRTHEAKMEMQPGCFPTGRWCVVSLESELLTKIQEPLRTQVLESRMMVFEPYVFEQAFKAHIAAQAAQPQAANDPEVAP